MHRLVVVLNLNYLRLFLCSFHSHCSGIVGYCHICVNIHVSILIPLLHSTGLLQVLISGKSGDWHETLNNHESDMEWHLVKRFNLQLAIDIIVKENHLLPRLKVNNNDEGLADI